MVKISKKVTDEVKKILPTIREEVKKEFKHWGHSYRECPDFYSDKKLLKTLPGAVYEYIILSWGISPERVNTDSAIRALNGKIFKDIHKITAHALRRLAFVQNK